MNAIEAQDFIDNTLKAMWPKWEPTGWQIIKWKETLEHCDFEASKRSIEYWYSESVRPGREPVLGIFNKIKCLDANWKRPDNEPYLLFALAPMDDLTKKKNFFNKERPADHIIEEMAERSRNRAEGIYGGERVVLRMWESKEPEPITDGRVGQDAREAVEEMYFDGPDCPERRFVESGVAMRSCMKTVDEAIAPPKKQAIRARMTEGRLQ